jgi:hypothetical protein
VGADDGAAPMAAMLYIMKPFHEQGDNCAHNANNGHSGDAEPNALAWMSCDASLARVHARATKKKKGEQRGKKIRSAYLACTWSRSGLAHGKTDTGKRKVTGRPRFGIP